MEDEDEDEAGMGQVFFCFAVKPFSPGSFTLD
jgi:hypothetical protein